jgi:hypothetical protein
LGGAKPPLGKFAFVIRVRIAGQTQGAASHGLTQNAAPVGFEDRRPEVLAAAEISEIGARAIHQQTAIFICQANGVTISPLYITIEVSLVGIGNPDGAGVKEIQTFEL